MHFTNAGIQNFNGEMIYIVLGENDPSAPWQGMLHPKHNARGEIVAGADHSFTGKTEEFIALPKILFAETDGE